MVTFMIVVITLAVVLLFVLFYFLNKRVDDMGNRFGTIYANVDLLHKNQEELLAQNLRMYQENVKKDKEQRRK